MPLQIASPVASIVLPWRHATARVAVAILGAAVATHAPANAGAQTPDRTLPTLPACASLGGNVLDAQHLRPLTGATVTLSRDSIDNGTSQAACVSTAAPVRTVVTGDPGRYRFDALAPGRYTVRVHRLGYKPATVGVALQATPDARVSVGLTELPVTLQPLTVEARRDSYARRASVGAEGTAARIAAASARREQLLALDARAVTHADVEQAVTLGETDLFRGVQRFAGISARDEYAAEFWARGGRWDQTRVLVDGLPLFAPTHAFGAYSALNPDAFGAAVMHLGVRPAGIAEGGSAVVDIRTRRGGDSGALRGLGELSLVGGRVALDRTSADGRTSWMLAGRRSFLDVGSWALERVGGVDDTYIPYHFGDLVGRVDHAVGAGAVEASGLYATDGLTGDVPQLIRANRSRRTTAMGRVGLSYPMMGLETRLFAGVSDYAASIRQLDEPAEDEWFGVRSEAPMRAGMRYATVGAELRGRATARHGLSLGSELVSQRARFAGLAHRLFAGDLSDERIDVSTELAYGSVWGEYRMRLPRFELALGTRADVGGDVADASGVRLAPRAQGRVRFGEATYVSLGAGRSFQYAQALPPAPGLGREGVLYPTDLWVVADSTTPALRTDLASLGIERQWGTATAAWIATANVFTRRSNGIVMHDVAPGPRVDGPLMRIGTDRAHGWELGVRRIAERWSLEAAYSATDVETTVDDFEFAAPYHRPHTFDLTMRTRLTPSLRASLAFSAGSGVAYTRVTPAPEVTDESGESIWTSPAVAEEPGVLRSRGFRNADLALEWTRILGRMELGIVGQLHNVLGRGPSGVYEGNVCRRVVSGGIDTPDLCERRGDRFENGLPLVPSFAVRLGF